MIFNEQTHEYYFKGKRLYSVSEMVNAYLGGGYEGVPQYILKASAEHGTAVHLAIELYNNTGIIRDDLSLLQQDALEEWITYAETVKVKSLESECMVRHKEIYAGTFDLLAEIDKEVVLADYKTTTKFHKERVELQLNFYRYAYKNEVSKLIAIWIPKGKALEPIELEIYSDEKMEEIIQICIERLEQQA